jgi:hypothetical protein
VLYEKHAATFLQQLRKTVSNILSTANNTCHNRLHVFLNTVCILVIFRISGKYPIRKMNGIYGPTE